MAARDVEANKMNGLQLKGNQTYLRDPPRKLSPGVTTCVSAFLKLDLVFRIGVIIAIKVNRGDLAYDFGAFENPKVLLGIQIETCFMFFFLMKFGRWDDQEHWITVWQTLGSIQVMMLRMAYFAHPKVCMVAFVCLWLSYFVGVWREMTKDEEVRLPPFVPKKDDILRPRYGWFGKALSKSIPMRFKKVRIVLTMFVYMVGRAFTFFIIYAFCMSLIDDLRELPSFNCEDKHTLWPLLWVAVIGGTVTVIPFILLEFAIIPGHFADYKVMRQASRSYRTGVFDVCELDGDDDENSELRKKMKAQPEGILPMTLVLPCYLPNETEIMGPVFDWFEVQLKKYPAESRVLLVFNSPEDSPFEEEVPEVLRGFEERKKKWAQWKAEGKCKFELQVERNPWSTSKCDNLNLACDRFIKTEICCLNDADTMLDWATMVRGSFRIHEGYDIAQSSNSHNKFDRNGTPGDENERSCHPFGALVTIGDSTKPGNMATQTQFSHAPFNGRGGFWRTSALKQVGFDHRTIGEDHDAGYRGSTYFGFKGCLDPNMICQEQEPPDCASLTSQRIRWETAGLEMRRTFSWILRSPFYGKWEAFVLIWSQLGAGCNMPFQALPLQVATALPLIIMKGYASSLIVGRGKDPNIWKLLCKRDDCAWELELPDMHGQTFVMAIPFPLLIFGAILMFWVFLSQLDYWMRVCITRYRPRFAFISYYAFLQFIFMLPYFFYVQFWALYDYCWGGGKFLATARSSLSPRSQEVADNKGSLQQPLIG